MRNTNDVRKVEHFIHWRFCRSAKGFKSNYDAANAAASSCSLVMTD
ncbi:MAG TPA: hypothetical protein VMZ26_00550 [Pyrinomonadaceae bacterium]|nr:hypothetical protein [Pyrinomonadaceae bacterium]